jgi:hypothetical protein
VLAALAIAFHPLAAAEYFVGKQGKDANNGLSRENAFATIQKGINALQPGDMLTIGPGEYFECVRRDNLGSAEKDTIIRAEIPGTALLRGDLPLPELRKVEGYRFVYAAPFDREPQIVLEIDTLTLMEKKTTLSALEFEPGMFCYDGTKKTLYISTSDMQPAGHHYFTACVSSNSGLLVKNPRRLVVDGLAAGGFYRANPKNHVVADDIAFGMLLDAPTNCVFRRCVAFLCGGGIGMVGGISNIFEDCVGYGSDWPYATTGNIIKYGGNHDVIRNCRAWKGNEVITYYGTLHGPSLFKNIIAWNGGTIDFRVKGGNGDIYGRTENCVALGNGMVHNIKNSIVGDNGYIRNNMSPDNIVLPGISDRDREFADPENLDFRLQGDSKFRGSAPGGADRGAYPYQTNIFFVSATDGKDENDGLSIRKPWKTFNRAMKDIRPGDTLYLLGGTYQAVGELSLGKAAGDKISIRGRGRAPAVIQGYFSLKGDTGIEFERLNFAGGVSLQGARDAFFNNCTFSGAGLKAAGVKGLKITHCVFAGAQLELKDTAGVFLSGNVYSPSSSPAVVMDRPGVIKYSDYNSYRIATNCWQVEGRAFSLEELRKRHDHYSLVLKPEIKAENGAPILLNARLFGGRGPNGTALGIYHEFVRDVIMLAGPYLYSVSDTTANMEWWTSRPSVVEAAWGDTPECENKKTFQTGRCYGGWSLTGLKPGKKYYFSIRSVEPPDNLKNLNIIGLKPETPPVSFETAALPAKPAVYYVAPDGNDLDSGASRTQAWQTVSRTSRVVRPGDTVLLAGGVYKEMVTIRVSGETNKPITFKPLPGEKVIFDGVSRALREAFVVLGRNHLNFDGFYFRDFGMFGWSGVFYLSGSDYVNISRCFMDGRGMGYANGFLYSSGCSGVSVRNCVIMGGFYGMCISGCPDMRVENNVFARHLIQALLMSNRADQKFYFRKNIVTDSTPFKVKVHVFEMGSVRPFIDESNCYYLRLPDEERKMFLFAAWDPEWKYSLGRISLAEYRAMIRPTDSILANPQLRETLSMKPAEVKGIKEYYLGDRIGTKKDLDFPDLFATNPEVVKRGIGLQPEAFKDFGFKDLD